MGCSHCFIEASSPEGEHMSLTTYERALRITRLLHSHVVIISGGEPFEHPDIFTMIDKAIGQEFVTIVATNGLALLDQKTRDRARATGAYLQISNDQRFYPRNLQPVQHVFEGPRFAFEMHIRTIVPCRRTREAGIEANRKSPMCFNLRSITRNYDIIRAISMLEMEGRFCSPSINIDGSIRASEADTCVKLGTIASTEIELDQALRNMTCARCGLVDKLDEKHLAAIGEKPRCQNE